MSAEDVTVADLNYHHIGREVEMVFGSGSVRGILTSVIHGQVYRDSAFVAVKMGTASITFVAPQTTPVSIHAVSS